MNNVLSVRDLRKCYGAKIAVDGVSFEVNHGEIVGLVGPNGAGKTTTISMILGVLQPDSGAILLLLPHSVELFLLHLGLLLQGKVPAILAWPTSRIDPESNRKPSGTPTRATDTEASVSSTSAYCASSSATTRLGKSDSDTAMSPNQSS